ncbi:MAG: CotH kinase family protein [Melioribacteraceae bacterium]|nr:CotH kinase family protein [Melioribacteraceae bacterium]
MIRSLHYITIILALLPHWIFAQEEFASSNLPIIIIDTYGEVILDEPKISAHMGIIYRDDSTRNELSDPFNHYNGEIGIELRGSSTQSYPKKSYAFETRNSDGSNLNVSLLGMPEENDWILYGPYSDKSLFRNILIYKLAREMGHYASRTKLVELVLNNSYQGVYILMEKIKRDKNRVDISKLDSTDLSDDELSGGYIIKIDKTDGAENEGWYSQFVPIPSSWQRIFYQYHYPDQDEIMPEQKEYIREFINNFEIRMKMVDYNDPIEGYYDLVDLESFADYFLLNEYPRNVDGFRLSAFMHKNRDDKDGRLKMGPIWDYNFGFGNADYYDAWKNEGWQIDTIILHDAFAVPFWWHKIHADPVFNNLTAYRWNKYREKLLDPQRLNDIIDSLYFLSEEAGIRNFKKWDIIGEYIWPNYYIGDTYDSEIEYLKTWIKKRYDWIDNNLSGQPSYVAWKNSDDSFTIEPNVSTSFQINQFYEYDQYIDSVRFISSSENLSVKINGEMLELLVSDPGIYSFKGVGWKNGEIVSVSPRFNIGSSITGIDETTIPDRFQLMQNYPNPFNSSTTIEFIIPANSGSHIPDISLMKLKVYDIIGREIATLVDEPKKTGKHKVTFDASKLPSGIYVYRLNALPLKDGRFGSHSAKMMLIK